MTTPQQDFAAEAAPFASLKRSVVLRFEEMAAAYPDHDAVTDPERRISYRKLDASASRLAEEITRRVGAGEAPVAMLLDHDAGAVLALVAILKSGRPYLSLRHSDPAQRMHVILDDAQPALLVTSRAYAARVQQLGIPAAQILYMDDIDFSSAVARPGAQVQPEAPFCLLYTSGSTGKPKGVVLSHRSIIASTTANLEAYDHGTAGRHALLLALSFAASYPSIMTALLGGGTVCIFDFAAHGPEKTLHWMAAEGITFLRLTPGIFRTIFEAAPEGLILPSLRRVQVGGERVKRLDFELYRAHTAPHCVFMNSLASSEAGSFAKLELNHDSQVEGEYLTVGRPLPGKELWLVDEDGQPVPRGEPGEIVVRSAAASRSYHGRTAESHRRFYHDPAHPGTTTVFTGDLGRFREDGELEFLGRKDNQVKVRGFRVELSEVEGALLDEPNVDEAVVVARASRIRPDENELAAYVVLKQAPPDAVSALRRSLASRLPDYMVPAHIVPLEALPLNSHGKVDRTALPEIAERADLQADDLPRDETEQVLVKLWCAALKRERVGVHDNFFELGGDSLSVLSMVLEVERTFDRQVPQTFFRAPTIRGLAGLLSQEPFQPSDAVQDFRLEGHRPAGGSRPAAVRNPLRRSVSGLRRELKLVRKRVDETLPFEWALARSALRLPFMQAQALVLQAAGRPYVWGLVYWWKGRLFHRFLRSVGLPSPDPQLFRRAVANNLLFKLVERKRPFRGPAGQAFSLDRHRLMETAPLSDVEALFPVTGLEHLESALQAKRGVILISVHGSAESRVAHRMLARRLGGVKPQVIAHNLAVDDSTFSGHRDLMPPVVAGAVYAEVAFYGQKLLQQGRIIHIGGDTFAEGPGRTFSIPIGDRLYEVKPGFAELALNTGASVIPSFGRFLEDGRLLLELLPPFDPGRGPRDEQIQNLIGQYTAFVNMVLKKYPEALFWKRLRVHLSRPRRGGS